MTANAALEFLVSRISVEAPIYSVHGDGNQLLKQTRYH